MGNEEIKARIKKLAKEATEVVKDIDYKELAKDVGNKAGAAAKVGKEFTYEAFNKGKEVSVVAYEKSKVAAEKTKTAIIEALDENGNGEIDIEDIIIKGFKTPGVRIDRANFLKKELGTKYPQSQVEEAIKTNPSYTGVTIEELDDIADHVIQSERLGVSGISAALGAPGGAAMVATVPADIIQYYAYMLRTAQKLLYLYGFPEIDMDGDYSTIDSETINMIVLCLGAMYGVASARNAIVAISSSLGKGISKKIMSTALTKGTVYPIIKQVGKWFSVNVTKKMLANAAEKSLPVIGGVIGGSVTYLTFKPCCDRLKGTLKDTYFVNPNRELTKEEAAIEAEIISESESSKE